jgi:hypothetical protein|tara:strand:- start:285 stop:446 length:162 start_codon:yes stop_codon:yes gene_type:complete
MDHAKMATLVRQMTNSVQIPANQARVAVEVDEWLAAIISGELVVAPALLSDAD